MKIHAGDIVTCIDNVQGLTLWKNYKVIKTSGRFICVYNDDRQEYYYYEYRFTLIKKEDNQTMFMIGQNVVCVDTAGWRYLTKGKVYKVLATYNNVSLIGVENDLREARLFQASLFRATPMEMPRPKENDPVHRPSHYTQGGVECIDAIESAVQGLPPVMAFLVGQVIKYLWRFYFKGKPLEDLEKAKYYLERLISKVKEEKK